MNEPREFWIDETTNGFDLDWCKRWVAEFPRKDSIYGPEVIHVIEYSAHKEALEVIQKLRAALEMYAMTNKNFPEYGDVARKILGVTKEACERLGVK